MTDPELKPTDGDPAGSDQDPKIFIDENEWNETQRELAELKGYKQATQDMELRLGQQHPELPPEPVKPPDPEFQYHSEEDLQMALDSGDMKKYHQMNTHNQDTKLEEKLHNMRTQEIEPIRTTGMNAISELSGAVAQPKMPHLDIPEVKTTYQNRLQALKNTGQAATAELHKGVYDWAVGENIDKVQDKLQQGLLRQQEADTQVNTPTDKTGRGTGGDKTEVPAVTEFFEAAAITKLSQKYPGLSPDAAADKEFARHGGFAEYYKKFYIPKGEDK